MSECHQTSRGLREQPGEHGDDDADNADDPFPRNGALAGTLRACYGDTVVIATDCDAAAGRGDMARRARGFPNSPD